MLAKEFHIRPWEIDELDLREFEAFEDAIWRDEIKRKFADDD